MKYANVPMYILRGLDAEGREFFYTGKAGAGWVSSIRSESFGYVSQHVAREKAKVFNGCTELHGLRFIAVPFDAVDELH